MNAERLTMLFHHRWAVPILAELHRGGGAKFVSLTRKLGMNGESASYTLQRLIHFGWVIRNPGHGHPMRPEYVLTPAGARLAPWCARAMGVIGGLGAEKVAFRKWSLPITLAIHSGRQRFSEMKAFLPGVTARALAMALKELQAEGFVQQCVVEGHPPTSYYEMTPRAKRLSRLVSTGA